MLAFINQPCGLGDILFCQKIGQHFKDQGYRVIWPVIPQYSWISHYIKTFEFPVININFEGSDFFHYNRNRRMMEIYKENDCVYVPLDGQCLHESVMLSKYISVGLPWEDWDSYLHIQRDYERERILSTIVNPINEEYVLLNNKYGSPPHTQQRNVNLNTDKKIISMDIYTVFDWIGMIENAKEIHTVETCFGYLFYKYGVKNVHLYGKPNTGFTAISEIYKNKGWTFHN